TVAAVLGFFFAVYYWWGRGERAASVAAKNPEIYALVSNKFYFDDLYQAMVNFVVLGFGRVISWFDRQIVNDTGVEGTARLTGFAGYRLKFHETGKVPNYALVIAAGVVLLAVVAFSTHT